MHPPCQYGVGQKSNSYRLPPRPPHGSLYIAMHRLQTLRLLRYPTRERESRRL
jgi:hypothetical protein